MNAAPLQVSAVPPQLVDLVWPKAARLLGMAVRVSTRMYTVGNILAAVRTGELALWVVLDEDAVVAAFTTRVTAYPNGRGLAVDWLGGERMKEWLPMVQSTMERYANDHGCTHLEAFGRRGWGRWLQKYGWEPEHIVYRMELRT